MIAAVNLVLILVVSVLLGVLILSGHWAVAALAITLWIFLELKIAEWKRTGRQ